MLKELVEALNAMDDRDPKKRACSEAIITQHGPALHVYWKGSEKRYVYFSVSGLLADAQ